MILLDANILLYAYNPSFERHDAVRTWLERALSGRERLLLAWASILAFLRVATSPRAFPHPLTIDEAVPIVSSWLASPSVTIIDPGERHWAILSDLLAVTQTRGPLISDAHVAALAIEHGALLCTTDRDFRRFPRLRMFNPLEAAG